MLPSNITPTTVTGTLVGDDGTAAAGTVTFTPTKATWVDDATAPAVILPVPVVGTLDSSGHFSVSLVPTNATSITPTGWTYDVAINVTVTSGGKTFPFTEAFSINVPSGSAIDLASVAPVQPDGSGGSRVVLSVNAKTPDSSGAVTLAAADVGALPSTYTPAYPVTSVNTKTGAVVLAASDVGALDATHQVVESVNGYAVRTVVLAASDVGAVPATSPLTLTYSPTIATNVSAHNHFRVTLTGNLLLDNPTGGTDGQKVLWELIQDGTGGRTLALGSQFDLGGDIGTAVLSTGAGKTDFLGAVFNASANKWYVIALAHGY